MRFCIYSWILLFTVAIEISCENVGPKLDQATKLGFEESGVWKSKLTKRSLTPRFGNAGRILLLTPSYNTTIPRVINSDPNSTSHWNYTKLMPRSPSNVQQGRLMLGWPSELQSIIGTQTPIAIIVTNEKPDIQPSTHITESLSRGCIVPERPRETIFHLNSCVGSCIADPGNRIAAGSMLIYSCSEGHILRDTNASFCSNNGWVGTPTCVKTCPALESKSLDISCEYEDRIVSCEFDIKPGTIATLACKYSYKIPGTGDLGYTDIVCLPEGNWDRPLVRCTPECGISTEQLLCVFPGFESRIFNGVSAQRGVHPWHVAIYDKRPDDNHEQICGGTMISAGLVLSAGHCFFDDTRRTLNNASRYAVAAGKYHRLYNWPEKDVQKSDVKEIILGPRYVGLEGNFAEDIALVRLQHRFNFSTFIRPICIDWENVYQRMQLQQGQVGKAVGWGKTASGSPSPTLLELNLPFIEFGVCHSSSPQDFKGYITSDKFCAGWLNGSSLCDGDSGGGLVFQTEGLWYLRGIASVAPVKDGSCDHRYYSAFTNIGGFIGWIQDMYSQEE